MGSSEHAKGWNDACIFTLAKIAAVLIGDALRFALYNERDVKPRRIDACNAGQPYFSGKAVPLALCAGLSTSRDLNPLARSAGSYFGAGSAGCRDGRGFLWSCAS